MSEDDEITTVLRALNRIRRHWKDMTDDMRADLDAMSNADITAKIGKLSNAIEEMQFERDALQAEYEMRVLRAEVAP